MQFALGFARDPKEQPFLTLTADASFPNLSRGDLVNLTSYQFGLLEISDVVHSFSGMAAHLDWCITLVVVKTVGADHHLSGDEAVVAWPWRQADTAQERGAAMSPD